MVRMGLIMTKLKMIKMMNKCTTIIYARTHATTGRKEYRA